MLEWSTGVQLFALIISHMPLRYVRKGRPSCFCGTGTDGARILRGFDEKK